MQCWKWSSRQQASLITNHMHLADLIITQLGNSLPVRNVRESANCTGKEFGGRFRSLALITCVTISISVQDIDRIVRVLTQLYFLIILTFTTLIINVVNVKIIRAIDKDKYWMHIIIICIQYLSLSLAQVPILLQLMSMGVSTGEWHLQLLWSVA